MGECVGECLFVDVCVNVWVEVVGACVCLCVWVNECVCLCVWVDECVWVEGECAGPNVYR